MRIVVALGGNALLKRGEPMTAEQPPGLLMVTTRLIFWVRRLKG